MDCHFEEPRKLKPNETVLRAGSLELDLIDRTAKRSDRPIDLRPRKFHLFKYMMQRSDLLQTRAALFDDESHYKFVHETNLVVVHMVDCVALGGGTCVREVRRRTRDAHQAHPRKPQRRRKCSTAPNIFSMAQRSGAPSVTESLVSSGTIPVELASVQRSALLASRPARRATADGYADLGRPDQALQAHKEDLEPSVCSLMLASVEEEPI
jgi:hypothetical protein